MATLLRKNKLKHGTKQLPHRVTQQLEKIYSQSKKKIKKHPYQALSSLLLSLGIASSAYFLIRYLKK